MLRSCIEEAVFAISVCPQKISCGSGAPCIPGTSSPLEISFEMGIGVGAINRDMIFLTVLAPSPVSPGPTRRRNEKTTGKSRTSLSLYTSARTVIDTRSRSDSSRQ